MTSMRDAIMSNPTLAETVRREEKRRALAQKPITDIKYRRDAAIAALIRARKNHKKVRPLLTSVLECVVAPRAARHQLA